MKPKSYKDQAKNGCFNCKNVFCKHDHDDSNKFYCHIDKSERPKCGSVAMEESHFATEEETEEAGHSLEVDDIKNGNPKYEAHQDWYYGLYRKAEREWHKWSKRRQVADSGICDQWEKKNE